MGDKKKKKPVSCYNVSLGPTTFGLTTDIYWSHGRKFLTKILGSGNFTYWKFTVEKWRVTDNQFSCIVQLGEVINQWFIVCLDQYNKWPKILIARY